MIGLFEFTNEENAVQVGYLGWITPDSSTITDFIFYEALITNNADIEMKWPKCDVVYSSKMVKRAQKVEWINVSARLLAYGSKYFIYLCYLICIIHKKTFNINIFSSPS